MPNVFVSSPMSINGLEPCEMSFVIRASACPPFFPRSTSASSKSLAMVFPGSRACNACRVARCPQRKRANFSISAEIESGSSCPIVCMSSVVCSSISVIP